MSVSEATVSLLFKARNLADAAVNDLAGGLKGIGDAGVGAAKKVGGAFSSLGGALANGLGNATETLAGGGGLIEASAGLGIYMAGQVVENMAGGLLEKLAGSTLIATITAPLSAIGTAAGGLIAAAVPIGMAALPALLIAALVAVVAVLIANPEIRGRVISFATGLVDTIVKGVGKLVSLLPPLLGKAVELALKAVIELAKLHVKIFTTLWLDIPKALIGLGAGIVRTIVNGLAGLPGAISRAIGNAFRSLKIDVGPFHITGRGVTVDLPKIDVPNIGLPSFAVGSLKVPADMIASIHKGEMIVPADIAARMRGERGSPSGRDSGYVAVAVSVKDLARAIDGQLYLRLQRAAASTDRA